MLHTPCSWSKFIFQCLPLFLAVFHQLCIWTSRLLHRLFDGQNMSSYLSCFKCPFVTRVHSKVVLTPSASFLWKRIVNNMVMFCLFFKDALASMNSTIKFFLNQIKSSLKNGFQMKSPHLTVNSFNWNYVTHKFPKGIWC